MFERAAVGVLVGATTGAAMMATTVAQGQEAYRVPPAEIRRILEAPLPQGASIDPTGRYIVLIDRPGMPSIEALAQPMVRLAGMRLNPLTNGRHTTSWNSRLSLGPLDGTPKPVALPDDERLGSPSWSPDGNRFVVTRTRADGIELWAVETSTGAVKRLTDARLNTVSGGYTWLPDGRLVCRLVPESRGPMPVPKPVPTGPIVQQNDGRVSPVRTYQDLLTGPDDDALFEHLATSELVLIDPRTGEARVIGGPDTYAGVSPAPDGVHLLVTRLEHPYSYLVPASSFPTTVDVWTVEGAEVARIADLPLRDTTPIGGVPTGRRTSYAGSRRREPHAAAYGSEALDGGDPGQRSVRNRDRVMALRRLRSIAEPDETPAHRAPLSQAPVWIDGSTRRRMVSEYDRDRRWTRTWLADHLDGRTSSAATRVGSQRQRPLRRSGTPDDQDEQRGHVRLAAWWTAACCSPAAARRRTAIDPSSIISNLETLEDEAALGEQPRACYEARHRRAAGAQPAHQVITSRRRIRRTSIAVDMAERCDRRALTHFQPIRPPSMRGVHRELVTYERSDGVPLSATLYLAGGLRAGHAPAVAGVGVSARVQRSAHRRPGQRFGRSLHVAARHVASVPADAGLRDHGRRDDAGDRRSRRR